MLKPVSILVLAVVCLNSSGAFAEVVNVSFSGIKELLTENNLNLKAALLEKGAAQDRTGSLARSFLPSFEVVSSQETFGTGSLAQKTQPSLSAGLAVNIFNGGRDRIEADIRDIKTDLRENQVERVLAEELHQARKIYWEILYTQENIRLLNAAIEINKLNLEAAKKRIRSGVATEIDRVEFEMKETDLNRELKEKQVKLLSYKGEFARRVGLKRNTELKFQEELSDSHDYAAELHHETRDHEFLFKDFELLGQQNQLSSLSQRRAWWPKLDLYAQYHDYNQRIEQAGPDSLQEMRNETVYGLRMIFKVPDTFESIREVQALDKEAKAAFLLADFKRGEVDIHIQQDLEELRFLHDQVHDAEANIDRAESYYKMTQSEYARGVKNSPDVLGASERLFVTKIKRIEILRDFQVAKAHVLSKIGK